MNAVRDPMRAFAVNAMATGQLALAAQRAGVRRLVFASSREVYGDPQTLPVTEDAPLAPKNVYGASKAAGEMFLIHDQARWSGKRDLEICKRLWAGRHGSGDPDLPGQCDARAAAGALWWRTKPGSDLDRGCGRDVGKIWISDKPVQEPVNVGSGCAIPLKMLAERILALSNSGVAIEIAPPRGPEVERFEADLTRAQRYFGLARRPDPLVRLAELITILQSTHTPDGV